MANEKTILYVTRHGKTMFNTITRTQGWCDTPLTAEGREGVACCGLGMQDIPFTAAYSSDSGRAIETARIILSKNKKQNISHDTDWRIREWCFGSLEGGYDGEMWGVLPRVLNYSDYDEMMKDGKMSYEMIANAILHADTANWAEPYEKIKERILGGYTDIAKKTYENGGGKVLIVSHGMTISNLLNLIDPTQPIQQNLLNASVSPLEFDGENFKILGINDTSYIEKGRQMA